MTLGGSVAAGTADEGSDIDLYVYAAPELSVEARAEVAQAQGTAGRVEIGNRFFEPGDEWRDAATGVAVDVMHRDLDDFADRLAAVLDRHEAQLGHTTCFWHNLRTSRPLFDRGGRHAALAREAARPYPQALARAIVAKNWPMLAINRGSWRHQLAAALRRGDAVSANHRAAAFLASWFDLLFALNREPHPGEKRLIEHARTLCPDRPEAMEATIRAFLTATAALDPAALAELDRLAASLGERLRAADLVAPG